MTGERRSFSPRTPTNDNIDKVTYRRGFITRHQVTGWRFVMRRMASGLALHDTRMLVDPLRSQSRAVLMGALLMVTALLGCFVFSMIRPNTAPGNDPVLADRATSALYVRLGDQLHPVLNLTSARLAAGRAVNPVVVNSDQLDRFPRGSLIGIPGAPERLVQNTARQSRWAVCDDRSVVSVIADEIDDTGAHSHPLPNGAGVLASSEGSSGETTWLLWEGRRSAIDVSDRAVADAVGVGVAASSRRIAMGLFNAIPEGPALRVPLIQGAGDEPGYPLPLSVPIGAVVTAYASDGKLEYYAVLPDGLQSITPVLAAVLRNANSYGLIQPPQFDADQIARTPVSRLLDVSAFPASRIKLVEADSAAVVCAVWSETVGTEHGSVDLLAGSTLPSADGVHAVGLAGGDGVATAAQVILPVGSGYLAESSGALFWIADTGMRYGIGEDQPDATKTIAALGIAEPAVPVPWAVLGLLTPGPTLSQSDALVAYTPLREIQ